MRFLILIFVLFLGCEDDPVSPDIQGCMDENACNYDDLATADDGSCLENDCEGVCGGEAILDDCIDDGYWNIVSKCYDFDTNEICDLENFCDEDVGDSFVMIYSQPNNLYDFIYCDNFDENEDDGCGNEENYSLTINENSIIICQQFEEQNCLDGTIHLDENSLTVEFNIGIWENANCNNLVTQIIVLEHQGGGPSIPLHF